MEKRWVVAQKVSDDLGTQILLNRNLKLAEEQRKFLHPHFNELTDIDNLFPNLDKAVTRIKEAIKNRELIYIYGDYDVDGITGVAILWETINFLGGKVLPYIPSRRSEGYGLHTEAIEQLARQGAKVIISVDCGITAAAEAQVAVNLGIDLIITDHHQPQDTLPEPFALIHTTTLAGSGVAFRLADALMAVSEGNHDEQAVRNLELSTIGTVADMVPLIGDNRIIVKNGLSGLAKTQRLGLQSLYEEAGIGKVVGTYEIGFMISPRLNAMGRLDSAMDSLRLLLTKDKNRASLLAQTLGRTNKERQQRTIEVFEHAKEKVKKDYLGSKFLVVDSNLYPEGVVGLVASRLVEEFYRPTAVIGKGEKVFKGSARSVANFNITQAIHKQEELLVSHGGHTMAAGFSIEEHNIPGFRQNLEGLAEESLSEEDLMPILKIDAEISLSQINEELETLIKEFEPFGMGNPEPLFLTKKLEVISARTVGKENSHIKLTLKDKGGRILEAVGFGLSAIMPSEGAVIDIVYNVRDNFWNSHKRLEARIKDLRKS